MKRGFSRETKCSSVKNQVVMSNIQPGIEDDVSWTMKNLGIIPTGIAEPSKIFSIITIGKVYFGAVTWEVTWY